MTIRPVVIRRLIAAGCLTSATPALLSAQALRSLSGAALSVIAPTETDYTAGVSDPTGHYTIATTCTGSTSAGCRLFLQYGSNSQGQQVDMEYAIVSLSSSDCQGAAANPNAWFPVLPTAVVLNTRKNRNCVATFRFRVSPLAWTVYTSPGPAGGAYAQQISFHLTRP
jgi:hypothetical protein